MPFDTDMASPSDTASPLWVIPHPQNLNTYSRPRIGVVGEKHHIKSHTHTSKIMGVGGPFPTLSLGEADLTQFSWRLNNPVFMQQDDVTSSSPELDLGF